MVDGSIGNDTRSTTTTMIEFPLAIDRDWGSMVAAAVVEEVEAVVVPEAVVWKEE